MVLVGFMGCSTLDPKKNGTLPVDHEDFTALLSNYVDGDGLVDYQGFSRERINLNKYLDRLSDNPPNNQNWSTEDKLAYWINTYNAFTIALVLDHYPLKSIKDIGSKIQIPFINTPWDLKFVRIGNKMYSLNNIEHNILRKVFDEPRIHFAINCASMSCPKLLDEAYTAKKLETQLTNQTREFLADPSRNVITESSLQLSKIFKWFGGDFERGQTKLEFVNRWTAVEINEGASVEYLDYDWTLNEQAK